MKSFVVFAVLAVGIGLPGLRETQGPTQSVSRLTERQLSRSVNYGGVSFNFAPFLAKDVKAETIAASLHGKPSDIWPEHPAFSFIDYPKSGSMRPIDPNIRVFTLNKFREAVEFASKENAKSVIYPPHPASWTIYFDEEVRVLKALLAAKPSQAGVRSFLARTRKKNDFNSGMPFLPMWEATQAFIGHVRYIDFKKGKGVFFLTQWDTETSQLTNEGLEYAFQGITDDGQHYVYAEFSVSTPVLPKGDEPEVVAWSKKNYLLPHKSVQYQNYLRPIVAKLETVPSDQFHPKLELLEQLMSSLEIKTK